MRVRIVGINRYKDRHGKVRMYWRRKGAPGIALDPELSGTALAAEVDRLEKKYLKPAAKAGTLRLLVTDYKLHSNHWRTLRPRTRKDYERVFTWLGDALDVALINITAPEMAKLRDKARDQHEPKFANQVVTTLKMVFRYGVERGSMSANPALGLGKATGGRSRNNRPLAPAEAESLLAASPVAFLPVLALALYCGIRQGDIAALPRTCRRGDWIGFEQQKTRRWHLAPVTPALAAILDRLPQPAEGEPIPATLLVNSDGEKWGEEGIKSAWDRLRGKLVKAGKMQPGATFHGLRHTGATWLEEAGYEEGQTKHFLGHGPRTVSGHYGQTAERRKLVMDMGLVIEEAIRSARGNVVRIGNDAN